jgi:hypothetical protein
MQPRDARALFFDLSGSPSGAVTLQVPAIQKSYIVKNGSGQTVTIESLWWYRGGHVPTGMAGL